MATKAGEGGFGVEAPTVYTAQNMEVIPPVGRVAPQELHGETAAVKSV